MKIADLIRRVRAKAEITPAASPSPRILLGGEQVGHGMTLGEVGMGKDSKVEFVFGE